MHIIKVNHGNLHAITCLVLLFVALVNCDKYEAASKKYGAEANVPLTFQSKFGSDVDATDGSDPERLFRISKLNVFWELAKKNLRGEQKLKKITK